MQTAFDAADPTAEPTPSVDDPLATTVSTRTLAGVTLVWVELHSTVDADLRVRIANELDGPVLPPHREGVPAAGWDADGFRGVVPASGRLGVGYACPVSASEERPTADSDPAREASATAHDPDAVSVDLLGPVDGTEDDPASVATAIRSLGRATPPADAVPIDSDARPSGTVGGTEHHPGDAGVETADAVPGAVDEWLCAVESRVQRAERVTDASAAEATAAILDSGGVDALSTLPEAVAADESALRAVAARIDALVERVAETDAQPVVSSLSAAANRERSDARSASSGDRSDARSSSNGDRSDARSSSNGDRSTDGKPSSGIAR